MTPARSRASLFAPLAAALLTTGCGGRGLLGGGYGIIGLIIVAFQIWAIVEVIQSGKETGMKVVWILVVLLLPVLGTILWFLLGRGK